MPGIFGLFDFRERLSASAVDRINSAAEPHDGYRSAISFRQACGVRVVTPFESPVVAEPRGWSRGPWRQDTNNIIMKDRTLQREYIDPDVVREMWNAYLSGTDHTRQLGVLIAIELFARQVIDGMRTVETPAKQVVGDGT